MIRIFFILFVVLAATGTGIKAQNSVSDFLITAFEDPEVSGYQNQYDFLRPGNYRLPVIDEVEVRVGNDEFIYEDVQYQLRLRPSNPWLIRRNNAFFNATKKELTARQHLEFKNALKDRYDIAVNYLYESRLYEMTQAQLRLSEQLTNIFTRYPESNLFDARDFVNAKLDMVDDIEELNETLMDLDRSGRMISVILGNNEFDWSSFELIDVATLDSISNKIALTQLPSSEVEYIASRLEVARQEVRKEKADFDIGFIQGEYFPFTNRDSDFGFSAGITLPIFKNNKPQIAERRLDEIEFSNELRTEQVQDSIRKIVEFEYLKSTIAQYELIQDEIRNLGLENLRKNLTRTENFDPIVAIELEIAEARLQKMLMESRFRILRQYIDFIFAFDAPNQQPLTNYLSKKLTAIE